MTDPWAAIDTRAREVKRAAFAESRRGWKMARERAFNALTAAWNLSARQLRRVRSAPARAQHELRRLDDTRRRFETYRAEWAVERELARLVRGTDPIIVGPWLSEVGYEVLYWVPFVRWIKSTYHVKSDRLLVVTRGGASAWYRDITPHAVELFDLVSPEQFVQRNTQRAAEGGGTVKQRGQTPMDEEIVGEVMRREGLRSARVLHPSFLYRLFQQFWLGHRAPSFLERRTKYRLTEPPAVALPALPRDYVAVKFYTAASLPPTVPHRRLLQSIVLRLAATGDVVMLDTGLTLDDHEDYTFDAASRIHSLRGALRAEDNLAVQTAVIARARSFVGTCGSLAWLAPLLGVETTAVFADPQFLHGHLQVARRVYQVCGAARFTPFDISALDPLGIEVHTTS
ncbi:MAG: hypothetical protein FJW14_02710 [Acidimicrobiia bacterium]|nr:hypothetical protein [Acidimicrobiia bacterium]